MTTRADKSNRFRPTVEGLEARDVPAFVTTAPAYLVGSAPQVSFTPILTVGDTVTDDYANGTDAAAYRMVGIPDGLGAFDNGDGTFTVLMNHELGNGSGITRDHGSAGAFVSRWVIRKSDLAVLEGDDLIKTIKLWNGAEYITGTTALNRLCSADLPSATAFYNVASGLGTTARIFMDGEEAGADGRAFAHVVTGPEAGTSYQLPRLGRFSWENSVANPFAQDTTIVAGTDDAGGGQVYFYVGTKTSTGTEVEKAGLTNGLLYGLAVTGVATEVSATGLGAGPHAFTLASLGDVSGMTGAQLDAASTAAGVTGFLRPEDGAWDPNHPNDFYFVTTNGFNAPARLWRAHFTDITNPTAGGTIEELLSSTELGAQMFDNITVDGNGRVILQEDPGNNSYLARVWAYDIATDKAYEIARHNPALFTGSASTNPTLLTQDEESSGVIDVSDILGPGTYLVDIQAHYGINNTTPRGFSNPTELVEGGQLLVMKIAQPKVESVVVNDGSAQRSMVTSLTVTFNTQVTLGTGAFGLTAADGGTVDLTVSTSVVGGKTVAVITFGGSLADGGYTFTVHGDAITDSLGQKADADDDGALGGDFDTAFSVLFGDLDGDGIVTGAEVSDAAHVIGAKAGTAGYFWFLDFDGDGKITGKDHREVARRNGQG